MLDSVDELSLLKALVVGNEMSVIGISRLKLNKKYKMDLDFEQARQGHGM